MSYQVDKDVRVRMRDGQALATDLWLPDSGPAPPLLVRTPYSKDVPNLLGNALNIPALVEAGYAVAVQDCRGTGRSDGELVPMVHEAHDGEDAIAWIADQPWCDGNVGTFGASYLGFTQHVERLLHRALVQRHLRRQHGVDVHLDAPRSRDGRSPGRPAPRHRPLGPRVLHRPLPRPAVRDGR